MSGGRCARIDELPERMQTLLRTARRGVLATSGPDESPHAVPICFAVRSGEIVFGLDSKPKRTEFLQRVQNLEKDPKVALLVDEWDEDWTRLAWVMVRGTARAGTDGTGWATLRAKYEQYADMPLDGPVIAIEPRVINWWTWK